jgi:hypothetical protein
MPSSACALLRPATPSALIQIRHGYEAEHSTLRLSVEADRGAWSVRVRSADGSRMLYAAERSSLRAAKLAATEFALLSIGQIGRQSPESAASQLTWRERW